MLNQKLQQKLLQKLSPQQILLMKLLQIPSVALEQRIKQEIEENPALEELIDQEATEEDEEEEKDEYEEREETEDVDNKEDEFDIEDYLSDDDEIPSYKLSANNTSTDDEDRDIPFASGVTFQELLLQQLGLRPLDEKQYGIGEYIIGNLDDSGYLQRDLDSMVDDLAFTQNINATKEEIKEVLDVIQDFDPPGIGARNLKECLLLQLKRREEQNGDVKLASLLVERYFNEFTKKHYDKIQKKAGINEEQLKVVLSIILKLNPKPGNSMSETTKTNHYVIPDFIIYNNNGELELTMNSRNAPELRLSKSYIDMLHRYAEAKKDKRRKDAYTFVKQKIDSAKWFIDAIKQRQNTLYLTMKAIMDYQKKYFLSGDERNLRPMILKDIAEIVNLDISTVSRVANSKYVQSPFGTFLLKSFFSESMQTNEGEEVSTREIKSILQDTIESESKSKPLTDEQLTTVLKEKGYNIARRTVAKYREQLNIPVARLRKEL
ncbi:MAG: RNA polymerase factor sigma-54 [Bacteroidales bacterium]|nr:RNA polymerase factor sigma-54 [Bacteroidales bacterium]MCF8343908.1 RNA polymerase factor sigma-54 [Bacteroidales bacterium]MCF8351315.1 RNA polymerase factor sigma-54 [Bacteroidales bacterium]MCF8376903.1 RNA polymerase factor sigma-54 [Bacteroidales bacterium]MCF8400828.1 RNA polymerase factor sigma-54 [Bacteroidales bacterium]